MGRDLVNQIMADKFIVFDSFDHAMFTAAGSQISEAVAAGLCRTTMHWPKKLRRQVAA
jgi:hypothetical protein